MAWAGRNVSATLHTYLQARQMSVPPSFQLRKWVPATSSDWHRGHSTAALVVIGSTIVFAECIGKRPVRAVQNCTLPRADDGAPKSLSAELLS